MYYHIKVTMYKYTCTLYVYLMSSNFKSIGDQNSLII